MDRQYPVGKFVFDDHATPEKRQGWIAEIDALPGQVADAVRMLGGGLGTPYRDGGWTARQVVHHLADSHLNAYTRVRLALTEEVPSIKTYEEQLWAELPDAAHGDPAWSLAILEGLHRRWTHLLRSLNPDQLARTARHPQWGEISVDFLIQLYAWHCRHHLGHLRLAHEAAMTRS